MMNYRQTVFDVVELISPLSHKTDRGKLCEGESC